ncbi:DUF805 domain-containing protein [Microlunatus elymi]|uniref:DUF805 domain-containing protein n=1 Tax=Microlunatus elymi TaxID=2596828 RepID=A0A516Q073_9ACTN|nr:DUF805 domain-containing protein [Microlunatus elymi]QDP96839.1 DUF805 domain-containing protein [Microlunatus elymi]
MSEQNPYGQPSADQPDSNPWRPVGPDQLQSEPYYGGGQQPPQPESYGSAQQPLAPQQYGQAGQQYGPAAQQYGPAGQQYPSYGSGAPTPQQYGAGPVYGQGQPYPSAPPSYSMPSAYPGGRPLAGDPGTLDLPYYGIGFVEAVKRAYLKIVRFDGRASRSEYWWYMLWQALVYLVFIALMIVIAVASSDSAEPPAGFFIVLVLWFIFAFGSILPNISITMRRFHDQNQSGGLAALMFIPYVGGAITAIMALMQSNPQGARYDQFRSGPAAPQQQGWSGPGPYQG